MFLAGIGCLLAPLESTVGNSHVLLGSVKQRVDFTIRIAANGMVDNLGQPMGRHLQRVSKKELSRLT